MMCRISVHLKENFKQELIGESQQAFSYLMEEIWKIMQS